MCSTILLVLKLLLTAVASAKFRGMHDIVVGYFSFNHHVLKFQFTCVVMLGQSLIILLLPYPIILDSVDVAILVVMALCTISSF